MEYKHSAAARDMEADRHCHTKQHYQLQNGDCSIRHQSIIIHTWVDQEHKAESILHFPQPIARLTEIFSHSRRSLQSFTAQSSSQIDYRDSSFLILYYETSPEKGLLADIGPSPQSFKSGARSSW